MKGLSLLVRHTRHGFTDFAAAGYLLLGLPLLPLLGRGFPEAGSFPLGPQLQYGLAAVAALFLFGTARRLFLPLGGPDTAWFLPAERP
jgi:hypothetical protein